MRNVYYNEIDPYCCQWLKNLISAGELPDGDVDCRSIELVQPHELTSYTHCHFFAGLGGWAYAARLAEWPLDKPLWTGSCPCQPFSTSGKQLGFSDPRHLWPEFFRLIRASRPAVVMGEQVTGKAGYTWFDAVADDLEGEDYATRAFDLTACAVGAYHVRPRLYWLADSVCAGLSRPMDMGNTSGIRLQTTKEELKTESIRYESNESNGGNTSLYSGLQNRPNTNAVQKSNGIPLPVGQVRAFGNAIVPQVAAEVLRAYLDAEDFVVRWGRLREMEREAACRMRTDVGARMGVDDAIRGQALLLDEAREKGLITL